jgi:hypothetical protein
MSKKDVCKSCSGPLDEYSNEEIIAEGFCPYCVNRKGKLKSYDDILEGMLAYIQKEHEEIDKHDQLSTAEKWLSEGEVWKDKFISQNIVVDNVREENIEEISAHTHKEEGFSHSCSECMYYQDCDDSLSEKLKWFKRMRKKYGECGKLLYVRGKLVSFIQFAPKTEFPKLKESQQDSTNTDVWYISCIYINIESKEAKKQEYIKLLIKYVLQDLSQRGVKRVETFAPKEKGIISSMPLTWKFYEEIGFKRVSQDDDYILGAVRL